MTTRQDITTRYRAPLSLDDADAADIDVPILDVPQRQGDIAWFPRLALSAGEGATLTPVPAEGVALVIGEATGNTHTLQSEPAGAVMFARRDSGTLIGVIVVPAGAVGWVTHTDEHGHHGIAPGTYALHGKRTQREEIERVQD